MPLYKIYMDVGVYTDRNSCYISQIPLFIVCKVVNMLYSLFVLSNDPSPRHGGLESIIRIRILHRCQVIRRKDHHINHVQESTEGTDDHGILKQVDLIVFIRLDPRLQGLRDSVYQPALRKLLTGLHKVDEELDPSDREIRKLGDVNFDVPSLPLHLLPYGVEALADVWLVQVVKYRNALL